MTPSSYRFALRRLARRPGTTAVHIGGLAIGLACCFLALLYVEDERSFDRFHEDAERIVVVERAFQFGDQTVQMQTAGEEVVEALRSGAPGVVAVTQTNVETAIVRPAGRPEGVDVENLRFADASLFDVFTFPLRAGDPATALSAPGQTILTEALAQTLFGTDDVVGEVISVERTGFGLLDDAPLELTVAGVAETPPAASSIAFDLLVSGTTPIASFEGPAPALGSSNPTYIRLAALSDTTGVQAAIAAVGSEEAGVDSETLTRLPQLVDQHFESYSTTLTGKAVYLMLFVSIAALVLLLACINYANLATALASRRSTEVGVRKALGAGRGRLGAQFLGEALLLAAAAGVVALGLTALALPTFNAFFGKAVTLTATPPRLALGMIGVVGLAGLVAGVYPALVLARFQTARVLAGATTAGQGGVRVRRGLVVFQFTVTAVLLAGTLLVAGQLSSLRSRDLGFQGDQVIVLDLKAQALASQRSMLKRELAALPGVERASVTSTTPGGSRMAISLSPPGTPDDAADDVRMMYVTADKDLASVLGLRMAAGTWLGEDARDTDTVLNEAGARALGLMTTDPSEAVGRTLRGGTVTGVVRDFHVQGPREEITPMVIAPASDFMNSTQLAVRIDAERATQALDELEAAWAALVPEYPFDPQFVDDQFADQLRADRQLGQLFGLFAGIAVLLACFGMLGLAAHAAEQRTKEFGIRKVLGASVAGLVARLSREFAALVVVALGLAIPVVVIGARRWLEGFAYPAAVEVAPFVGLALAVLALALGTVSVHALRVAIADPVHALRSE